MARVTCSKCDSDLDGSHKSYCKKCFAEYVKARTAQDPEKRLEHQRQWRARNPDYDKNWLAKRYAADPEKWSEYHRAWRRDNPEARKVTRRKSHLKSQYGISIQDFEAMMYVQGNCCLVCGNIMTVETHGDRTACVDHDHDSGDIRGLLCSRCNNGLGCFSDRPDLLIAAAAYLTRYELSKEIVSWPRL